MLEMYRKSSECFTILRIIQIKHMLDNNNNENNVLHWHKISDNKEEEEKEFNYS